MNFGTDYLKSFSSDQILVLAVAASSLLALLLLTICLWRSMRKFRTMHLQSERRAHSLDQQLVEALAKQQSEKERCHKLELRAVQTSNQLKDVYHRNSHLQETLAQLRGETDQLRQQLSQEKTSMLQQIAMKDSATAEVLGVLGLLQTAIHAGDVNLLSHELDNLKPFIASTPQLKEKYGELYPIVEAAYHMADERKRIWTEIAVVLREALSEQDQEKSQDMLAEDCRKLLEALKNAQLTGFNVNASDKNTTSAIHDLFAQYAKASNAYLNRVHRAIIAKIINCKNLGTFDFTDLDLCLHLVDREEVADNEFFLSRALSIVNDATSPGTMKATLSFLETVLFFMRYIVEEDVGKTYEMFREGLVDKDIHSMLDTVQEIYPVGVGLVDVQGRDLTNERDMQDILNQLTTRRSSFENMNRFQEIFLDWSTLMKAKLDLIVLPHHVQVVTLLLLQHFVEHGIENCGALIAQVSTGEGKSMIIAILAIYVAIHHRCKVHVVVDDENLLERDYASFKPLFDRCLIDGRQLKSSLCVSANKLDASEPTFVSKLDPEADIVYCEAKHVQSHYARIAKKENVDFSKEYGEHVLILDEVDALIIDEEPNEAFVYENQDLSNFATDIATKLNDGITENKILESAQTVAAKRVLNQMHQAWGQARKWKMHENYVYDNKQMRYFLIQNGKVNESAYSLVLECKNFQDGFTKAIIYNERLFVMSRPRVFQKYRRIIGLSGSVGSQAEADYLSTVYAAKFFTVPKFLKTCRSSPCHEPICKQVFVEDDRLAQIQRVAEIAFHYRASVPVLIISEDRTRAEEMVQGLQSVARSKGLDANDTVRSLSRFLYENFPAQFKTNLYKSTQPTIGNDRAKSFRIIVTDPRGGRGTDYRVDDQDADNAGGLLIVIMKVPDRSRDWIQYLGRTARQDKQGQYMVVVDREQYDDKIGLSPDTCVKTILALGDQETAGKIQRTDNMYNRGLRMNELCEVVQQRQLLKKDAASHEIMVQLCTEYAKLNIKDIDQVASGINGLQPHTIPTLAKEIEDEPQRAFTRKKSLGIPGRKWTHDPGHKAVMFCIDGSSSMLSTDANGKNRWDACRDCILKIFKENVDDEDFVGLVAFADNIVPFFPLAKKATDSARLETVITGMQAPNGLTAFFDAVAHCMEHLNAVDSPEGLKTAKWLVALTDGDDNRSSGQPHGELVTRYLQDMDGLNLLVITVGSDIKPRNIEIMNYWTNLVQQKGGIGLFIPVGRPAEIESTFGRVAEIIEAPFGSLET